MGMAEDLAAALCDGKCPVCCTYYGTIRFEFEGVPDEERCETCERLRAAIPEAERPPIEVIEFRDNTRRTEPAGSK